MQTPPAAVDDNGGNDQAQQESPQGCTGQAEPAPIHPDNAHTHSELAERTAEQPGEQGHFGEEDREGGESELVASVDQVAKEEPGPQEGHYPVDSQGRQTAAESCAGHPRTLADV